MFSSLIARSPKLQLVKRGLHNAIVRTFANRGIVCSKSNSCKMENIKSKYSNSSCHPKEPSCMKPFSECEPVNANPCKPQTVCCGSDRLSGDPCYQRRVQPDKKDLKISRQVLPQKSVWEYPAGCCGNPCPDLLPRFDNLYYRVSDKMKRQYQQTWVECPPLKIKKRKVCCYDPTDLPPVSRRPKAVRPETACAYDLLKMKALCCVNQTKKCPRIKMPCCRTARSPPLCKNPRGPTDCKKRCCPYPAFSECCRPCPRPKRPMECYCLGRVHKCVMYAYLRRKLMYGLPPPLPAWPPKMIGPRY